MRGGVKSRREALATAGAFLITAACNPEKLFGPCEPITVPVIPAPVTTRDVYIVDGFTGSQEGTKENPYSVRGASEFDALMRFLRPTDSLAVHYEGRFKTAGVYRWGQYASRNLGAGWTIDGAAEIELDPDAVSIMDGQPLYCLAGPATRASGITTRGNHPALADRWTTSLRTGGVLLEGDGAIDGVQFRAFGSRSDETFVATVADGTGPASITNCLFDDFDPASSDTQVTVFLIGGKRSFALMEGNETRASGQGNWVQGHTIYEASEGVVRNNRSTGAKVGYYADFWTNRNRTIQNNHFLGCEHGVQLTLSPTAGDDPDLPKYFSHEDYTIGWNEIESSGANVSLNTLGPSTATRFIRNIEVDSRLSLENYGATDVRRTVPCRMAA